MLIYDQSVYIMLPLAVCYDCSSILLCTTIEIKKDMNADCFFTFGIILKIVFLYDSLPTF